MRKGRILALLLSLTLLCGCTGKAPAGPQKYQATYWDLFDTVTTIVGWAESEEEFQTQAGQAHELLMEYHRLFDIYQEYEGMSNLKTVNDHAGIAPVQVDGRILELLTDCRYYGELTEGKVNVAMGSVLSLWHTAREDSLQDPEHAYLPGEEALRDAAEHTDMDCVRLFPETSEIFLLDEQMRLDVGAVAKGWSVQRVAQALPEGLLLNVGGNVCATGPAAEGTPWVVGVQDPDGEGYLKTLSLERGSLVTSGDYQRCYTWEGKVYHHIIDPETLYPSELWRSVTVYCEDSGLADVLSTALFLMTREEGEALLAQCGGEALWLSAQGEMYRTPGFENLFRD